MWGDEIELRRGAVFIADAHYIPHTDGAALESMICELGVERALESIATSSLESSGDSALVDSGVLDSSRADSAGLESAGFLDSAESRDSRPARHLRYVGEHGLLGLLAHLCIHFSAKDSSEPRAQVFLMGDVAHLFLPHISIQGHEAFIALINALAKRAEVFYLEGNHDFGLDSRLMPEVRIYPRSLQPLCATLTRNGGESKRYALAHGDLFVGRIYECYIRAISAPFTLSMLKLLHRLSLGGLYRLACSRVNAKKIRALELDSTKFGGFGEFAKWRMACYGRIYAPESMGLDSSMRDSTAPHPNAQNLKAQLNVRLNVIEGHFHIGRRARLAETGQGGEYVALPSFYCDKRILVL